MSTNQNIGVVTALENLIKVVATYEYNPDVEDALTDAKIALGYDPVVKTQLYTVSLVIDVEDTSPEGAVDQYRDIVGDSHSDWVYLVTDEDGVETWVDTYAWMKS